MTSKRELDDYLNEVSYAPTPNYRPSAFSLKYLNFLKMMNLADMDESPEVHLRMLDGLGGTRENLVNLCSRGLGKTVLFGEVLGLYLGAVGEIDGFGTVNGMLYVSDAMDNGVKNFRSNIETRYLTSDFLQYWIPEANFTENFIEFKNKDGRMFGIRMYGASSGIRGTKIYGNRPHLVVMDDLIKSDEDAASPAVMGKIRNTIYKGIIPALDPKKRKIILNGTPFNKGDIMCEAVESGAFYVNVWPVCEEWPCTREEFRSAWPSRFTYDSVKNTANLLGPNAFAQEMMLRLTSPEDRLVQDTDIATFSLKDWKSTNPAYTVYITTDFATTESRKGDWTVASVWAVDHEGRFRWIGGFLKKQLMDATVDGLFELVEKHAPLGVAIEVTGQQGGFIPWLTREMVSRSVFFNLLSHGNGNKPGIRVVNSKLQRFHEVIPLLKAGKIMIPHDVEHPWIDEFWTEIRLATGNGLKSKHDDVLDTISQLFLIRPVVPAVEFMPRASEEIDYGIGTEYPLGNYLV